MSRFVAVKQVLLALDVLDECESVVLRNTVEEEC